MTNLADLKSIAPIALGIISLLCGLLVALAKLYHNKIIAKKDLDLKQKEDELLRANSALAKAEARVKTANINVSQKDLQSLRGQLESMVDDLARSVNAQAASLYIPVFSELAKQARAPRSFAFVAVCNDDPRATAAILKMKVVETWTIVGECWQKNTPVANNQLQSDTRHVKSYDAQSGFVPLNTLTLPVRWQDQPIGVLQVFNKKSAGQGGDIDLNGFSAQDKKVLAEALKDLTPAGLASTTYQFQTNPAALDFLGLREESILENTVIMHVDLTSSSSLYNEVPLQDVARMLCTFSEFIHNEMVPYTGVVERFNGDGALVRFHYVGFDSSKPATNPVVRAVHAAESLLETFNRFKETFWHDLTEEASGLVKLRITIALGPVVAINMGSQQSSAPTVIGPCVNRSAKMVAYAPRDRDVVLIDDNSAKALAQQKNQDYVKVLKSFSWGDENAITKHSICGSKYYELAFGAARLPSIEFRPLSKFSAA
jgi:class 3 adenylate cyclase